METKKDWFLSLEKVVKKHNSLACNLHQWESWEDWAAYYKLGLTPENAYLKSIEKDNKPTGERLFGDNFGTLGR